MSLLGICMALAAVAVSAYYFYFSDASKPKGENREPPTVDKSATAAAGGANKQKKAGKGERFVKHKKAPKLKIVRDPRFIRRFGGHSEPILDMSVSPNGEWLATTGLDHQVRVTNVHKKVLAGSGGDPQQTTTTTTDHTLSTIVKYNATADDNFAKGNVSQISWAPDNRTLVGPMASSNEMALFRMRKKKDATGKFPFELIELAKKRFPTTTTNSKAAATASDIAASVVDQTHVNFLLVLTASDDTALGNATVAWDADAGQSVGSTNLGNAATTTMTTSPLLRLSPDGRFLCRGGGSSPQVKIFEVQKKKAKGEVLPVFDRISPKGVMTLVAGHMVADVCYFTSSISSNDAAILAVVCCTNGWLQVWDLNVEYKLREDPKRLCEYQLQFVAANAAAASAEVTHVAACSTTTTHRIAVVTSQGSLHLLTYNTDTADKPCLVPDFTIDKTHEQRVADVQFCPSGDVVYTRGERSKDIFAWKV